AYGWLIRVGVVRYCRICWVGIALEYIGHERRSVHGTEHSVAALDWLHSFFPAHLVNHGPACATQCDAIGREAGRNICAQQIIYVELNKHLIRIEIKREGDTRLPHANP